MRGQMAEEERWTDTALFCLPAAAQHSETPHRHSFSHDLMVFSGFAHTWPIFSFNFSTHHGKCVVSRFNTVLWPVYQLPNSHHRHGFKSFGTIVLPIGDDQKQLKKYLHCIVSLRETCESWWHTGKGGGQMEEGEIRLKCPWYPLSSREFDLWPLSGGRQKQTIFPFSFGHQYNIWECQQTDIKAPFSWDIPIYLNLILWKKKKCALLHWTKYKKNLAG